MHHDPVTALLDSMEGGTGVDSGLFAPDAVLDATVPNWRIARRGAPAVATELSSWYRHPGRLDRVSIADLEDGRVAVEVDLSWVDDGIPHACHQLHLMRLDDDHTHVSSAKVWCGGRWPADLLAAMQDAEIGETIGAGDGR